MATIQDWKQFNGDIGFVQAGSKGAKRSGIAVRSNSLVNLFSNSEVFRVFAANNPDYATIYDDFYTIDTGVWDDNLSASSTLAAQTGAVGGKIRFTTHTDADANSTLARVEALNTAAGTLLGEYRVAQVTNASARQVEIGFNDSKTETSGRATTVTAGVVTATSAAYVGFVYNSGTANWIATAVKAGAVVGYTDTGVAVSTSFNKLTVVVDSNLTAIFYVDGVEKARIASAVATTSVTFTPWMSISNLTVATARSMDVDYALVIQNRV